MPKLSPTFSISVCGNRSKPQRQPEHMANQALQQTAAAVLRSRSSLSHSAAAAAELWRSAEEGDPVERAAVEDALRDLFIPWRQSPEPPPHAGLLDSAERPSNPGRRRIAPAAIWRQHRCEASSLGT